MAPKVKTVTPEMIDLNDNLLSTFGQFKTELAAVCVIAFCQLMDGWAHFTRQQIEGIYNQRHYGLDFDDCFDQLLKMELIEQIGDHYVITERLINRCFKMHPAGNSFAV